MGLGINGFNFLKYFTQDNHLGEVLTLGRTSNHINWIDPDNNKKPIYIESILKKEFKAISVSSLDASSYEGATIIHNLNNQISEDEINRKFDSILDLGVIEHVFNVPNALLTIAKLCKNGGHIIHSQTHNDCSGHGFWQFSPELFFSWYSESNGFSETEVFLVDINKPNYWIKCTKPSQGERISLEGKNVPYSMILVKTKKVSNKQSLTITQSDYEYLWEKSKSNKKIVNSEILYFEDLENCKKTNHLFLRVKKTLIKYKFLINIYYKIKNNIIFKFWYEDKRLDRRRKEYFFESKKN